MTSLYPGATYLPVVNHGGSMSAHLGLVLHVQVGNGSLHGYFNNPESKVSSNFWCAKDGRMEQYVDANLEAWAQAAGNATYNSVETEGYPDEPLTDAQIKAIAHLYVWGANTYRWPYEVVNTIGAKGLGTHVMGGGSWSPSHHQCPGTLRSAQRQTIIIQAKVMSIVATLSTADLANIQDYVWIKRTVHRGSAYIPAIQELANSVTLGMANQASLQGVVGQLNSVISQNESLLTAVAALAAAVHDLSDRIP